MLGSQHTASAHVAYGSSILDSVDLEETHQLLVVDSEWRVEGAPHPYLLLDLVG